MQKQYQVILVIKLPWERAEVITEYILYQIPGDLN